jgi:hypothetical protein
MRGQIFFFSLKGQVIKANETVCAIITQLCHKQHVRMSRLGCVSVKLDLREQVVGHNAGQSLSQT